MTQLPDYLEGEGKNEESIGAAVTTLLEVSDFIQFREMMLCTKRNMDEDEGKHSEDRLKDITISSSEALDMAENSVKGMMELCSNLAVAQDADEGWTELLTLPWMKIEKKPVPESERKSKSEIFLRGVWTLSLNFVEACDMMFTLTKRRTNWDTNFSSCSFPFGGSDADDDIVSSVPLNFGYLINLAMFGIIIIIMSLLSLSSFSLLGNSKGTTLNVRNFRQWNKPSVGSVTYAMVPWDLKKNVLDVNHKLLSIKTGTIQPHPTLKNTVVMTTLEKNTMGGTNTYTYKHIIIITIITSTTILGMPNWAMHFMMKATAPNLMKTLESRYIANARNKNDVVDVTPNGRGVRRICDDDDEDNEDEKKNHK